MKKDLSVLMLLVRNSFWRVIGVILVMIMIDGFMFFADVDLLHGNSISLEELLKDKPFLMGFMIALLWITNTLTLFGSGKINKEFYTLKRLQLSESQIWFWQALYHTLCYLLLFIAEITFLLFLGRYYVTTSTYKAVGSTSMLRMFSTNHFLYNLLPYHNLLRWFRNLVMVVGLGITSATEPVANRRGISTYLYGPQLLLTVIVLIIDVRFWLFDLLVILLSGFITVKVICYVKKGDEKHDS